MRRAALAAAALFAGCSAFSDGSGQNSKWGHVSSYEERCRQSKDCPTLRSRLAQVPGLGWLFKPVGLGPCLPTTDFGQPQPCGGWPVLGPGAHVKLDSPQQGTPGGKALGTKAQGGVPDRIAPPPGGAPAPPAADQPPGLTPADCEEQRHAAGDQMSPKECYKLLGLPAPPPLKPGPKERAPASPATSRGSMPATTPGARAPCPLDRPVPPQRPSAAELILRILSRQTYGAVEQGGSW